MSGDTTGQPGPVDLPSLGHWRAVGCAALAGFGVMAAELTAVRLLAPHFGDSAYVWTNVIGVILAAMALGATAGGRLSARSDFVGWPFRLLAAGAALLLLAPFATPWIAGLLLPEALPLDAAMPTLIRGSLVATALVFAPPLLLLSAVSPLLIVWLARTGSSLGRAAGDVAAAGTIGSLIGTFAATHWLVPWFGCRIALVVAAAMLLLAAMLVRGRARAMAPAALAALAIASIWCHQGPLRAAPAGSELLAERETPYQFLQVVRTTGEQPRRTSLVINEALDSFHSLQLADSRFTGGAYYDWHAIAPLLVAGDERTEKGRALSIGDAAGTLRMIYQLTHPEVPVDAVDIDPATMALGDEFFTHAKASGERYAIDGRLFVERATESWQVIHVDAYAHQVYVPAHVASREFFTAAHARLSPGGVLACNVGALTFDDAVLRAIAATVADVFGNAQALLIPNSRNALLLAGKGHTPAPTRLASVASQLSGTVAAADREHWQMILSTAAQPERWHAFGADDAAVLTDDRPWLDELLFQSYVADEDPHATVACTGQDTTFAAEQAAYAALQSREYSRVFEALRASSQATALLRRYAGDARWFLRQLHSAELEYEAALQLQPEEAMRSALVGRLQAVREDRAPIVLAERSASQNGWLVLGVVAAGIACAFGVGRL